MMTLKAITRWDGEREIYGVQDTDGGIWWPHDDTQSEILASDAPEAAAVRICDEQPMRGQWSN